MKTIKVQNKDLEPMGKALTFPLQFSSGRIRTRFMKLVREKGIIREESRQEMLQKYTDKEKDGTMKQRGGHFLFKSPEAGKKFEKEYLKLQQEEILIDLPSDVEKDLPQIKTFIEISPAALTDEETDSMEVWIAEIERLTETKADKKKEAKKKK